MKVPLVDLKAQYCAIRGEIDQAIHRVIERSDFILGVDVKSLEEELASYTGCNFGVGVASGTDALLLALLACGIRPGDEVITTPFTFIATAEAITQCGALPVFVDIDPRTYNIDCTKIEAEITEKTRAILPVHLYGQPTDMDPLLDLAKKYNLKVIEDCAQSLGAEYKGQKAGSLGDAGCLSFFPSKILGAYGDGGMVVTNNQEIAEKVDMLRRHGCRDKYYHVVPGYNSRLDTMQAAVLRVKLDHLNEWNTWRREKAQLYSRLLRGIPGIEPPCEPLYSYHIFNYYTVRLQSTSVNRCWFQQCLKTKEIATAVYYPVSLHLQEAYKGLGYKLGDFPHSESIQEEVLSLPIYPELEETQIDYVIDVIGQYCGEGVGFA